ncbi:MAG: thioredoxin family protein [bacterium]|nr:thioredoxin family protein [bacterium]
MIYKKLRLVTSVLVMVFVLLLANGYGSDNKDTVKKDTVTNGTVSKDNVKKNNIKVTFIELGSVRCIPCKKMKPIMDAIEKEFAGQVKVVFHDVWETEGKAAAKKYNVKLIPTQVFLDKEGNEYFRHVGFFPKEKLVKILKQKGVK